MEFTLRLNTLRIAALRNPKNSFLKIVLFWVVNWLLGRQWFVEILDVHFFEILGINQRHVPESVFKMTAAGTKNNIKLVFVRVVTEKETLSGAQCLNSVTFDEVQNDRL